MRRRQGEAGDRIPAIIPSGALYGDRTGHIDDRRRILRIPDPVGNYSYELHQGVLVRMTRPKLKHTILQGRSRDQLRTLMPQGGFAEIEFPFRPLPEHELRVADVANISPERWAKADPEDIFHGAPDIVIEVLSPSNTASEIPEKEQLCLENGCREFWVMDDKRKEVRVTTADGRVATYKPGQSIPIGMLGSASITVDSIFGL
jgi:Uma2 family endonuclease